MSDAERIQSIAQEYLAGTITISEAAHRAGITLREMMRYLMERGHRSEYSIEDLERESLSPE